MKMKYRTRFGKEYDLSKWSPEHMELVRKAYWHYSNNMDYEEFVSFILGSQSPVLNVKKNGPIPAETPLYDVVTDLEFRLGVKQEHYEKDWEGETDPEWLATKE
jgi:hypothetical protein